MDPPWSARVVRVTHTDRLPRPGHPLPDDASLLAWASSLLEGSVPDGRSLWLAFLDADHATLPLVVPIDELPVTPDTVLTRNLVQMLAEVTEEQVPGASMVLVLERTGPETFGPTDRTWLRSMLQECHEHAVRVRGTFLAAGGHVRAVTPDDLV